MKKNDKDPIVKIRNRRTIIGIILLLPLAIGAWTTYLWSNIPSELSNIIDKISIFSVVCFFISVYMSDPAFIKKELEDKKLKNSNYKFKYRELIDRYVPPYVVKLLMIILCGAIFLSISMKIHSIETISFKEATLIRIRVGYILFIILETVWMMYCNGFSEKKEIKKYIFMIIAATIITIIMFLTN